MNLPAKRILQIFLIYTIAHFPFFALYRSKFWDDWSLYGASPTTLSSIFQQAGVPLIGYFHIAIQALGWPAYSTATFFSYFFISAFTYKILIKIRISDYAAFWISSFVAIIPVNYARITAISSPSAVSLALFMGSWLILLSENGTRKIPQRIIALLGFAISFQIGSLIVFYVLPILTYLFITANKQCSTSKDWLLPSVAKVLDFILLPIAYWIIRASHFPPTGMFEGYNSVNINLSSILNSFPPLFETLNGNTLPISTIWTIIAIVFSVLASSTRWASHLPNSPDCRIYRPLYCIPLGIVVCFLAVFPYSAVGKIPSFLDWTATRHQLLLAFGFSILLFSVISTLARLDTGRQRVLFTAIPLFISIIFIGNWWKIYSEFYVDHIKQQALIALIKKHPEIQGKNLIVLDSTELTAFSTKTGLGEYAAIYSEATNLRNSLILDYTKIGGMEKWDEITKQFSPYLGTWSKTDNVSLNTPPLFYVMQCQAQIDDKFLFSLKMIWKKIFHPPQEKEVINSMLLLNGPFKEVSSRTSEH